MRIKENSEQEPWLDAMWGNADVRGKTPFRSRKQKEHDCPAEEGSETGRSEESTHQRKDS